MYLERAMNLRLRRSVVRMLRRRRRTRSWPHPAPTGRRWSKRRRLPPMHSVARLVREPGKIQTNIAPTPKSYEDKFMLLFLPCRNVKSTCVLKLGVPPQKGTAGVQTRPKRLTNKRRPPTTKPRCRTSMAASALRHRTIANESSLQSCFVACAHQGVSKVESCTTSMTTRTKEEVLYCLTTCVVHCW